LIGGLFGSSCTANGCSVTPSSPGFYVDFRPAFGAFWYSDGQATGYGTNTVTLRGATIPEPMTSGLVGMALVALGWTARQRRRGASQSG
jgi:hypothetical protein